jgi:serine/threonine-protein kinase
MSFPQSIEGKYEVLAKLSEGGMGAVYKVRHTLLDEVRVIKVILPHLGHTAELSDRFLREARAASRLRHPNIAQILDFLVDKQGHELLVMEFIDGLTLKEILRRTGPPSLGLAVEISRQALAALGYLHRRGFVHRDISPDNLMLARDPDGRPLVKLIDLGIAKAIVADLDASLTQTGIFLGKPRYASPEQLEENGHVDTRSDLYSFGIVLYELLTGRVPIAGRTPHELMAAHLLRPPLPFAESDPDGRVPPGLREVVLRMLEKKPQDRLATAEELSERLAPFAAPWPDGELARILNRKSDETGPYRIEDEPPADSLADPSTWADGVAPTVAHATRRTVQPEAAPVPSPPRRSGYTTVPDDRSQPIPPPQSGNRSQGHPEGESRAGRIWAGETPALPDPSARPSLQDDSGRGRRWLPAVIAAAVLLGGFGLWRALPHRTPSSGTAPPRKPTPAVEEPSPVPSIEPELTTEPLTSEAPTPVEETPAGTPPPAGFVKAQPLEPLQPDYPELARGTGLTVRATVDVEVDGSGRVLSAKVPFLASATTIPDNLYTRFRDAALDAARRTRFQPATRDGAAVSDKVRIIVEMRE